MGTRRLSWYYPKTTRRCLGGISALLIFWLVVSTCKHLIFENNVTIVRYLWYAYYIPQILITVLSLITVLMVGKGENARPGRWSLILFGAGGALVLLVLKCRVPGRKNLQVFLLCARAL